MIRKRIEIVMRGLAATALLAASAGNARLATAQHTQTELKQVAAAGRGAARAPETWVAPDTHAFPVYLDRGRRPQELEPVEGIPVECKGGRTTEDLDESPCEVDDGTVPHLSYSYSWTEDDARALRAQRFMRAQQLSRYSPGLWSAFPLNHSRARSWSWLSTAGVDGWSFGERSWQNRIDRHTELSLGSSEIAMPAWNDSIRLGGISLSQSFLEDGERDANWNYSLAIGAVDHTSAVVPGDLTFGPMAGSLLLSYEYNPQVSLLSQTEVADDLLMSDVTGEYDLGTWGRWRSGVSRSTRSMQDGWRYRVMGDVSLADDIGMAWVGERYTDGFMDIRRYAAGADQQGGARQRWTASWDAGRWGTLSGRYESVHGHQGVQERRFGVNQQFYYSPNLQVEVRAEREVIAGDYDIGLRFSFPLN